MYKITCNKCNNSFNIKNTYFGKTGKCKCGQEFLISYSEPKIDIKMVFELRKWSFYALGIGIISFLFLIPDITGSNNKDNVIAIILTLLSSFFFIALFMASFLKKSWSPLIKIIYSIFGFIITLVISFIVFIFVELSVHDGSFS